jgi:hypothetical protein
MITEMYFTQEARYGCKDCAILVPVGQEVVTFETFAGLA